MIRSLIFQKLFFALLDGGAIVLAFVLAFYLRLGSFVRTDFPFSVFLENALLILPIWLLFLIWGGRYELQEKKYSEILRVISLSSITGAMLFVLIFFFRREVFFSRLIVVYIIVFGIAFGMCSFLLEKIWEYSQVRRQKNLQRVLVIGINTAAQEMILRLKKSHSRFFPIAALAPFGGSMTDIHGVPVLGKLDALERITVEQRITDLFICDASEQMLNLIAFAEGRFLGIYIAPEILGVFRENVSPQTLAGKNVLTLSASPLFGWGQLWKRGFDLVIGMLIFICCLPFWFLKKIFQPHKKLFAREERIGGGGKIFRLWRFRTSTKFFRDIPNILNVLGGEMSLVGPRPILPEEWKLLPHHLKRRMVLKPGIFGLWQITKLKGAADDIEAMCTQDIRYLQNWNFWGDLKILGISCWHFFRHSNTDRTVVSSK